MLQVSAIRKECDDLKLKLFDYEKMSKFQKVISDETSVAADLEVKVEELRKQLNAEQRERKSEVNNVKMKYDSRVAIMNEEIVSLKSQCSKYRRERESYKVMTKNVLMLSNDVNVKTFFAILSQEMYFNLFA